MRSSPPRCLVHIFYGCGGGNNQRQLFLFAIIALVIFSIVALNYFCPENLCHQQGELSTIGKSSSAPLISSFLSYSPDYDVHYGSSSKSINEAEEVDQILDRYFSFNYDRYRKFRLTKTRQVSYNDMKTSPLENAFQIKGNDVMVFLHMQKTGGSAFDRHLVRDLILEQPCKCEPKRKKKCRCFRPETNNKYWLFSRYSIGWVCGLHADYTELINCVDRVLNQIEHIGNNPYSSAIVHPKALLRRNQLFSSYKILQSIPTPSKRRYFFITLLRDPIVRFISEFKHVQRGATWISSRHWCDGRLPTPHELPRCFRGQNWRNVTLSEFVSCPYNLAFNRQTRMLADLSLVGCYNRSIMTEKERDLMMLYSAKQNLRQMAYFGICEEQIASQKLYEHTFGLRFKRTFIQFNQTRSMEALRSLSSDMISQIRRLNHLDMALYSYAKQLFRERFGVMRNEDVDFDQNYQQLLNQANNRTKFVITKLPTTLKTNSTLLSSIVNDRQKLEYYRKNLIPSLSPEEEEDEMGEDQSMDAIYDDVTHVHDSVEDYYSNHIDIKDDTSRAKV
ncbi:hypothetical protein RDWZM_000182 [Blomia tropicalis]|uniref:Heparan-sulfate 6-O-sulfotransferase n=1 Tax=Blomia tropicalis TaxID=40697 RepID=A0A9Q0MBR0_BLOTA|nr:hypothetical protein RDWZM_000182 [Blomia tropicalis]